MGGRVITSKPKGFAANPKRARLAGMIGGKKSKRGPERARADRIKQAKQLQVQGYNISQIARIMHHTNQTIKGYLED